jgi:hypothetical protein
MEGKLDCDLSAELGSLIQTSGTVASCRRAHAARDGFRRRAILNWVLKV